MSEIVRHIEDDSRGDDYPVRRVPVVRCNCKKLVECWDSWANDCSRCGTEYNGSGQQLAPRHFWGEETGETF